MRRSHTECQTKTHHFSHSPYALVIMVALSTAFSPSAIAADENSDQDLGLFALPFEEALDIEVISSTRTPGQDVFTSPGAIYVITSETIKRSGHRSIPELLRMVPGLYVAKIDQGKWIVASRGFPELFYRMMLVQIDGRTVYSPLFSGVFWESLDLVLDDIDRIEVVRGPGGSLWGANAVNGVINIITKKAQDTQGTLIVGGAGTEHRGFGSVRYGGQFSDSAFYRIYYKAFEDDGTNTFGHQDFTDDRSAGQFGFRMDWEMPDDQDFTLQGDYHRDRSGNIIRQAAAGDPILNADIDTESWNILGKWHKQISEDSDTQLIMYYDRNKRDVDHRSIDWREQREIFDIDFQHSFLIDPDNRFVWGLGLRREYHAVNNIAKLFFNPASRTLHTFSGFLQDTITLRPGLDLIFGTKLEHNEKTGFEYQPRGSIVWKCNDSHTLWASVSRAVRVPSLTNLDETIILVHPIGVVGSEEYVAEEVLAYEIGYRTKTADNLSFDIATFLNQYDNLESTSPHGATDNIEWDNNQYGQAYGVEISVNYQPIERWRLSSSYTFLKQLLHGGDITFEERFPENQFQIQSYFDITEKLELNTAIYYYDNNRTENIADFIRLDVGLAYHPNQNTEIGVWGQNLLEPKHQEFGPDNFFAGGGGEIQRGVYGYVKLKF